MILLNKYKSRSDHPRESMRILQTVTTYFMADDLRGEIYVFELIQGLKSEKYLAADKREREAEKKAYE